jgi:hypothetical protein
LATHTAQSQHTSSHNLRALLQMYAPVTIEEYIGNMKMLLVKMRSKLATNGVMIWSTTTPVPPSYRNRNNTDVVAINAAMATVLADPANADIQVNDL